MLRFRFQGLIFRLKGFRVGDYGSGFWSSVLRLIFRVNDLVFRDLVCVGLLEFGFSVWGSSVLWLRF